MHNFWKDYRKKFGIYRKLVFSFLVMLGIPLISAAIFYSCTMNIVKQQSERMGQNILEMTKNDIDACLEGARNFESRWYMDDNVRKIADIQGEISREYAQTMLDVFRELVKQSATENIIERAFIYFSGSDKIISTDGNMNLSMYHQLYMQNAKMNCDEFRDLLREHHQYDTMVFVCEDGVKKPVMMLSLKNGRSESDAATIGLFLDYKKMQGRLLSANSDGSDAELMVLSERGEAITPTDGLFHLDMEDYEKLKKNSRYLIHDAGRVIWVTSLRSEKTNWNYLMLTTSGIFARDIKRVRMIFLVSLFLSIFTGFGLSCYLAGKTFHPFREILDKLRAQETPEVGQDLDEMQWLSRQVENILQKNVDAQKMLDKNKKHMREFCLWNLITVGCDAEQLENYGIVFPYKYFLVAILLVRPIRQNDSLDEKTAGLRRFIVHNIFAELTQGQYRAECFEFGDRVVTIFNLPENDPKAVEIIHENMDKLREMICSPFHFDICGLIGAIHAGQSGIRSSYKEAAELSEYLVTLDENIISVEDICGIEPRYEYLEDIGEKLAEMVSIGNQEAAEKAILEVFSGRLSGGVSLNLYRSLVYEIIGSLLKGATAGGYMDAASEVSFPSESVIRYSMEETKKQLLAVLGEISRKVCSIRQAAADNSNFSREVEAYIDEHFTDPDLNISITSQHFDRSPAYLSGLYKKQTGRSLLEYINMKRISFAETLLKEGVSVVEAAERSGFRDSGGFIRTFKRYRGITPGQLKGIKK